MYLNYITNSILYFILIFHRILQKHYTDSLYEYKHEPTKHFVSL